MNRLGHSTNAQTTDQDPQDPTLSENPFGLQGLLEIQRRNFQALNEANRTAMQGWQSLFRRQMDMAAEMFQTSPNASSPSVDQTMASPATGYSRILSNASELASMMQSCTLESASHLNRRTLACLAEVRSAAKAASGRVNDDADA